MKNLPLSLGGRALLLALLALVLVPLPVLAAGENYGQVSGYVYDPTGAPLSEVPLTLSGPSMLQPQSTVSGEDGRYEFNLVPPGEKYALEVKVEGFTPIKKTGLTVRVGQSSPVDVKLEVLTETQAVATYEIVTQVNPILNPDSAQLGAVLTAEKASATPVFNQVQAIPQLVAGVGPGNAPSSRGGLSRYGRSYVDGMDTTDVTDGSISAPFNFYAVENFEVITGGMDAQYNSMGMIENVVTKSGSNDFTYDVSLVLSPAWGNAKALAASNQGTQVGGFTQNTSPQSETTFYSPLASFGGPIIKDRLWFYASGQWNFSHQETPITIPGGELENRPKDTQTRLARLKLTYQPTAKDRISVAFNYDRNTIDNNISNAGAALDAESKIDRGGFFFIVNYDRTLTENMLFQLSAGTTYKNAHFGPQNEDDNAVAHTDSNISLTRFSSGALGGGRVGNFQDEEKRRWQFDPTLTFKVNKHQMKAGVQLGYLTGAQTQGVTGNQRFLDRGGVCDPEDPATFAFCDRRIDFYNPNGEQQPLSTDASVLTLGTFLQDRWTVNRHLTVVGGLRFDAGRLYADDGQFITNNLKGFGPRLSGTYDVFGDRNTLLKAAYGRVVEVGDVFVAQHGNPDLTQVTTRWNAAANSFAECTPFENATGCTTAGGPTGRIFDRDAKAPHSDEVSFGLAQAVGDKAAVGMDFTYRRYSNMWVDEEVNQIWDASGTRVVGYVNGEARQIVRITTPDDAWRDYKGMDLWVQGKSGPWDLLANYTLAFANGTVANYFDNYGANPRFKDFQEGPIPDDIRHTLKGSLAYATDFGLDFGFRFRYLTGTPLWMNSSNPGGGTLYRSPRGTGHSLNVATGRPDFNDPSTVSQLRNPDQFLLDAQARYDLGRPLGMKQKLELTLLVVNLFNNTDVSTINDQYAATGTNRYGTSNFRNRPLQAELLLRFRN
jgi:hypothetical protein